MKKLFFLIFLAGWIYTPLSAQSLETVNFAVISNTATQKCYTVTMRYTCSKGNCDISIYKIEDGPSFSSSGAPNVTWNYMEKTICYDKRPHRFRSKINCQVNSLKDGCVVVIEGG